MSIFRVKAMLIVFFDMRGLIHKEFPHQRKTVKVKFYKKVLQRLHTARRQTEATGHCHRWRLHHDNSPALTAFLVTSYLVRIGVEVLPQPPYSPAMTPPDFFLLPKEKRCLKGYRFDDIPNIQRALIGSNITHLFCLMKSILEGVAGSLKNLRHPVLELVMYVTNCLCVMVTAIGKTGLSLIGIRSRRQSLLVTSKLSGRFVIGFRHTKPLNSFRYILRSLKIYYVAVQNIPMF